MIARSCTLPLIVALAACATRPPAPALQVPDNLPALPTAGPGEGIAIIDVTDGPTQVSPPPDEAAACTSPCALALPLGSQPLVLRYVDSGGRRYVDTTSVLVLPEPQVLRRTLERNVVTQPARYAVARGAWIAGQLAMLAGLVAWPFAQRSDGARGAARGLAAGGGAMFVLSIPLAHGTFRRSAGAEVQFPLPSQIPEAVR